MELFVEVNIPEGKEDRTDKLLDLARNYNGTISSPKRTSLGINYRFDFKNEAEKNSFYDAVPVDWL